MREEFKDFYEKITDPRCFPCGEWFSRPKSGIAMEFLDWYSKEYWDCIELKTGSFRVVAYPCSEIRNIRESNSVVRKNRFYVTDKAKMTLPGKRTDGFQSSIPGTERPPSEISLRILRAEAEKKNALAKEHLARLEQRRKFAEFVKMEEEDDDGL